MAYYLAANTGKDHQRLLENVVVLLDPCLNPDGFERFAHWANNHRGAMLNPDPNHREHREAWPRGRTNYYWFDLNRDWLPLQHPESQGRVAMFYHWRPNVERLQRFITDGGTLVAIGTAIRWLNQSKILSVEFREATQQKNENTKAPATRRPYAEARRDAALDLVRGSIVRTHVDLTHPIGYGFSKSPLPVFRNNTVFLQPAENPYSTPVVYDSQPLLSGYVSPKNLDMLSNSASVVVRSRGRGRVVLMAENPNFRGFWFGTNRLFLNALFFSPIIREP